LKNAIFAGIVGAVLALTAPFGAVSAATLLPAGTLNTTDDLTRIDDAGTVLEFLDVSATTGQTSASALSTYSASGFAVATFAQVTSLFDAFNITLPSFPSTSVSFSVVSADAANAIDALGATFTGGNGDRGVIGNFDRGDGQIAWMCIAEGTGACSPTGQIGNNSLFDGHQFWGVYMVREINSAAVPLPAGFPLLLAGLGCFGIVSRKRRRS